jgi:hypothetical protein
MQNVEYLQFKMYIFTESKIIFKSMSDSNPDPKLISKLDPDSKIMPQIHNNEKKG